MQNAMNLGLRHNIFWFGVSLLLIAPYFAHYIQYTYLPLTVLENYCFFPLLLCMVG